MYVELDIAPAELVGLSANERQALENLGQAAFHGLDYLVMARPLADALADTSWLSEMARAAFSKLAASRSTRGGFDRPGHFVVVTQDVLEPSRFESGWKVPLKQLSDRQLLNERSFICEDLDDVDLYVFIAQAYAKVKKIGGVKVTLRPVNGGGSNTPDVVARTVARGESFLVIVDSDKRHSCDDIGDVARGTQREFGEVSWFKRFAVTPGKSVENLVPLAWLRLTQTGAAAPSAIERLEQAEAHGCQEIRAFGSLKQSFALCAEIDDPRLAPVIADIVRLSEAGARIPERCNAPCAQRCHVWIGLGSSVPRQVLNAQSKIWRTDVIDSFMEVSGAEDLAQCVFEFGLAQPRMRA